MGHAHIHDATMATTISPTFTTTDRRKRIATYGKSSRPQAAFPWGDDAPSPDRPRKLPGAGSGAGTLKKPVGLIGRSKSSQDIRGDIQDPTSAQDVFDVPSDEDMDTPHSPIPPRRTLAKKANPVDAFDVPSLGEEGVIAPQRRRAKTPQLQRKPTKATNPSASQTTVPKPKPNIAPVAMSHDLIAQPRRRAKTPQSVPQRTEEATQRQNAPEKPTAVKSRGNSRRTTPAPPTANATVKPKKSTSTLPQKPAPKAMALDVFDVPSSDDDVAVDNTRKPRSTPLSRPKTKKSTKPTKPISPGLIPGAQLESDNSDGSRKRKRQVVSKPHAGMEEMDQSRHHALAAARANKLPRKDTKEAIAPSRGRIQQTTTISESIDPEPVINKPKRTRLRTVPTPRPQIVKGISSPAKLHGMLTVRQNVSSAISKPSEPIVIEDDATMYDIPDVKTPRERPARNKIPESITPKASHFLDDSTEDWIETAPVTPGLPSIRRLQLTDRRPQSKTPSMIRSSSDIPLTAHSRKPRLIDTLRQAALPSEDDDEGSEEGSDEEEENETDSTPKQPERIHHREQVIDDEAPGEMDLDSQPVTNSQQSQNAMQLNTGHKITYAKQRSYREEANFEDNFLLAMDFDITGNNSREPMSDDEDDLAGQVQGIHELRRKGQNQKFLNDTQTAIDDISGRTKLGNSVRRNAMMELCSQMADTNFLEQLLDSGLVHQLIDSMTSNKEIIFDLSAIVAIAFIANNKMGHTVLGDMYRSSMMETLYRLITIDTDVNRIAKERKTNMSRLGREAVDTFRTFVLESSLWDSETIDKVSPQIMCLKALELLVVGLRKAGSTEALVDENAICKILDIASSLSERMQSGKATPHDSLSLNLAFSIMEATSISKEKQATWSNKVLRRVVDIVPTFLDASDTSPIKLAVRLCMNLTNNKPKACDVFAGSGFVQPLVRTICHNFSILPNEMEEEQRTEVMERLILSLGAMINLAEYSDEARENVMSDGGELVDALARTFLEGSEKAAKADSMEASQASVTIGYLTVLLGNLCLNDVVRHRVQSRLPGHRLEVLVDKIREFIRYNERVDRETAQFEGDEGRETWQNFTMRLQVVVERLEKAERE